MVQLLGIHCPMQGTQVQSLARELRFCTPWGSAACTPQAERGPRAAVEEAARCSRETDSLKENKQ